MGYRIYMFVDVVDSAAPVIRRRFGNDRGVGGDISLRIGGSTSAVVPWYLPEWVKAHSTGRYLTIGWVKDRTEPWWKICAGKQAICAISKTQTDLDYADEFDKLCNPR